MAPVADRTEARNDSTPAGRAVSWPRRLAPAGVLLLIALVGTGLYMHTLHFDIVFDDRGYVMENPFLKNPTNFLYPLNFTTFAMSARTLGVDPDLAVNFITRPVSYATFYWNRVAGGTDPAGYRVVNIIVHVINGMLLFGVVRLCMTGCGKERREAPAAIPAAAALLFMAHPLMTESVTYISQRFESLATMFYLGGVFLFLVGQTTGRAWVKGLTRVLAVVSVTAAMLSKETGSTAPLVIVMMLLLCAALPLKEALQRALPALFLVPLVPVLVFAAATAQNHMQFSFWRALNITNIGTMRITPFNYALTEVCASISYLRMLILPVGQNFDHDYPLIESVTDLRFLGSLAMIAALVFAGWRCYRRWGRPHGNVVLAGVLWYFITLAPSSSIIPLPDFFAEHRTYLPSIGLFLAIAGVAGRLLERMRGTAAVAVAGGAAAVWICGLGAATLARNEVLRDDVAIYRDALVKSPHKARVWNGLGCSLAWSGKMEESLEYFEQATKLQPRLMNAWKNSATALLLLGKFEPALKRCEAGLKHDPINPGLKVNYAVALAAVGRTPDAIKVFDDALKVSPLLHEAHLGLARIYSIIGPAAEAVKHYRDAMQTGAIPPQDLQKLQTLEASVKDRSPAVMATLN